VQRRTSASQQIAGLVARQLAAWQQEDATRVALVSSGTPAARMKQEVSDE